MTKITIGARGSKLSLAYVAKVKDLLLRENKNLNEKDITIKTIRTSGDINQFHLLIIFLQSLYRTNFYLQFQRVLCLD
jgi:porphobilinogen deaminase